MTPEIILIRPQKIPYLIDWPDMIYNEAETTFTFVVGEDEFPFFETDIKLIDPAEKGHIKFEISFEKTSIKFVMKLVDGNYEFSTLGDLDVLVAWRRNFKSITKFFYDNPPIISFVDGSSLIGNIYTELKKNFDSYLREKIKVWDWNGIDIKKEPQGEMKEKNTIQYRVIKELKENNYDVIFDDHGKGEAADILCVHVCDKLNIEFYHCKSAQNSSPGRRVGDLYEVCSQAQRSIRWMEKEKYELFDHLLRREAIRKNKKMKSRFELGNQADLIKMQEISRNIPVELKIFIVQLGLSKSSASIDQLKLLSVTENYLMETCQVQFGVIASD